MSFYSRFFSPYRCASLISPVLHLWAGTLHVRHEGLEQVQALRSREPVVFALWHDELFTPCYVYRKKGLIALVSSSQDGEYLAQLMLRLGYNLARGSSSRQGLQALREALNKIRTLHQDVVFTVDGPRGPRHQAKEGAIYLAHKANSHLVPVRVFNARKKVFHRAWDKFQLPWPGSSSTIYYGQPYKIEHPKLNSKIIKQETLVLEDKLNRLLPDSY